jgi:PAS domain S-box-containing protein
VTESKSVLVVEDEAPIALGLTQSLREFGFGTARTASTGENAIQIAHEMHPDLILMDIQLAGRMNGIEAARAIQQDEDIPVIYITAYSDDSLLQPAKHTSPYGYLVKPVRGPELRTTIEVALHKHELDRRLRESEERYYAVITQTMDGIILFDPESHAIVEANPAFQAMFGYSMAALSQKTIYDLIARPPDQVDALFFRVEKEGLLHLGEQKFRHKNSTLLDVECNSSILHSNSKKYLVCVVAHNITERKKAECALREANRKLQLLNSITRHDILNKVSGVLGYLAITEMRFPDPELSDYIHKLESATKSIRSHMEFTRLYQDLGTQKPKWHKLETIIADLNLPDGITLDSDIREVELFADLMLEKVFYNLLDNSIRHGQTVTKITVSSRHERDKLIITWSDNGIGIPVEEKEQIFERGFGKNTGLGLFLVREILSLTKITISETGEAGKGARFEIAVSRGAYRISGTS